MNIKKALLVTFSTGLIATTLVNTNYVSAEEANVGSKTESDVEVKFTQDTSTAPELINPLKPGEPNDLEGLENEGKVTSETGSLTLDYVSNFNFGVNEVNLKGDEYNAVTTLDDGLHFLHVTDRRGPDKGWHVTASLDEFKNKENPSLPGATIHLKDTEAVSDLELFINPFVNKEIKLESNNEAVDIASSSGGKVDKAQGVGSWVVRWLDREAQSDTNNEGKFENRNVYLKVPQASASKGEHETQITWTLTDGPSVNHDTLNQSENE